MGFGKLSRGCTSRAFSTLRPKIDQRVIPKRGKLFLKISPMGVAHPLLGCRDRFVWFAVRKLDADADGQRLNIYWKALLASYYWMLLRRTPVVLQWEQRRWSVDGSGFHDPLPKKIPP